MKPNTPIIRSIASQLGLAGTINSVFAVIMLRENRSEKIQLRFHKTGWTHAMDENTIDNPEKETIECIG